MDEKDLYGSRDLPPGEVPPDTWGATPERGKACKIVEDILFERDIDPYVQLPAHRIIDALIAAGLITNEMDPHDRMRRGINQMRSLLRQWPCLLDAEEERLRKQAADEGWLKS